MARTAPAPNIPPIPGMNPCTWIMGGGAGAGGGGAGTGKNGKGRASADGENGDADPDGGNKTACGGTGDGGSCPNHHGSGSSGAAAAGDPVDVVTGRVFTVPAVDLELGGPLPLLIVRQYNSDVAARDVGLGFGWVHSLSWAVEVRRGVARVWAGDGSAVEFGMDSEDDFSVADNGWVMVRTADGLMLDTGSGRWYVFAERVETGYRLSAIRDRFDNCISLRYESGRLSEVVDSVKRVVRVRYGTDGRIGAFEAKNAPQQGRWIPFARYHYDQRGNLVSVTDADDYATTFTYDDEHLLASHESPTGLAFFFRYDRQKRCIETWGAYRAGVDVSLASGVPASLADGTTRAKGIHHCKIEYGDDGYREVIDSVRVQRYFGNARGKVDKVVNPQGVYERTYDAAGNLLSFTDPLGAVTTWTRDGRGRELSITDPLGRTTRIDRDEDSHIREFVDAGGGITRITRQHDGLSWSDASGASYEVKMDGCGRLVRTVAPNGYSVHYRYDELGNMVEKSDSLGAKTEFEYDHWGRCIQIRAPRGAHQSFVYSDRGDLLAVHQADGSATRYQYDGMRNLVAIQHPNGYATSLTYGGMRKVAEVRRPNGETRRFRYNREGRLVEIQDGRGALHHFTLDQRGLVVEEQTFDGRVLKYAYDACGRLIRSVNGAGERTELRYDLAGQLLEREYHDGSVETFSYDALGNVVASSNAAGTFNYERNAVGAVVAETQDVGGEAITVRRTLDEMGDVTERSTSLGHSAMWFRDLRGLPARLVLDAREEVSFEHDLVGRETLRTLGSGGRIAMGFDSLDRMIERQVVSSRPALATAGQPATSAEVEQRHRYSPFGELLEIWDRTQGLRAFEYDPARQILERRWGHTTAESFRYDEAGNLFDTQPDAGGRTYGAGNRLLQMGSAEYSWDADGRLQERRVMTDRGPEVTRYTWAANGLLRAVERPDSTRIEFLYDPYARRVAKNTFRRLPTGELAPVGRVRFVWDGADLVHELKTRALSSGDPVVEERTYVFQDGVPLAHSDSVRGDEPSERAEWLHYLNDPIGTPERLLRSDGSVASELRRSVWGKAGQQAGSVTTPLGFRGQYHDEETGLAFNRYRYYDPDSGRYISPDPLGVYAGLNQFSYAENQPTRQVDPDGLMPKATTTITPPRGKPITGQSAFGGPLDPALQTAVNNAHQKFDSGTLPTDQKPSASGQCAEIDALNQLAVRIRQERSRSGQTLPNPNEEDEAIRREMREQVNNGSLVTTDQQGNKMDPCKFCAQVFRELGMHPANRGRVGRRNGVIGSDGKAWNGNVWHKGRSTPFRTAPSSTPPFTGT